MSGINGDNMVVIPVAPEKIKSWDEFKNELVA
jgi:hypothetical protein